MVMSRVGALVFASMSLVGCLEGGERIPTTPSTPATPGPVAEPNADRAVAEALARASGALAADEEASLDEAALEQCADTAYACFEQGERSPSECLDTYILCVVDSGVPADHDYLQCLAGLSGCWRELGSDDEGDLCHTTYDTCIAEATPRPDPREPDDVPDSPTDPVEACALAADECLASSDPESGQAQAACLDAYAVCLTDAGVPEVEPYFGCLGEARVCLAGSGDAGAIEACWDGFMTCYEESYGTTDPYPEPDPDIGESPCESETYACYDEGGSNLECIEVLETCLLEEGVPEDHPYMVCLGALISCVGPAEASAEPDAALDICAETFNQCVETTVY